MTTITIVRMGYFYATHRIYSFLGIIILWRETTSFASTKVFLFEETQHLLFAYIFLQNKTVFEMVHFSRVLYALAYIQWHFIHGNAFLHHSLLIIICFEYFFCCNLLISIALLQLLLCFCCWIDIFTAVWFWWFFTRVFIWNYFFRSFLYGLKIWKHFNI